jgi:hypothetical protein
MLLKAGIVGALLGFSLGIHGRSVRRSDKLIRQSSFCDNTATSRNCWGQYSVDTDYYETTPDTGVTREVCEHVVCQRDSLTNTGQQYWLVAEQTTLAPDGYERGVLVFNGTLPGPTIEADWGDEVVIHVTNNIPDNGWVSLLAHVACLTLIAIRTAIHWHGIRQLNTNVHDGKSSSHGCPATT